MNIKRSILAILLLCSIFNTKTFPSVAINVNWHPSPVSTAPFYPSTYVSSYYPTTYSHQYWPTHSYSYWPTWSYNDYYWLDDYYYDSPGKTFVKTCAVIGVLALAFSIIEAILGH